MRFAPVLLFCFVLAGQDIPRQTTQSSVGTAVKNPVVDYYDSMSDYFRQSPRAILLISKKGIPDVEIPALLYIARHSSASPNQLIAARKSGASWAEIADRNKVKLPGSDFASEANVVFLSEYHGRPQEEVRALRSKGGSFIDINQEFRRAGAPGMKRKTEK